MVVSTEVEPQEIIKRTTHKWAHLSKIRLQIKDLQFIESKTVVTFFIVPTATPNEVVLAKLSKIPIAAQGMAEVNIMVLKICDFSKDIDAPIGNQLPAMKL
jgi:hypothetical protein